MTFNKVATSIYFLYSQNKKLVWVSSLENAELTVKSSYQSEYRDVFSMLQRVVFADELCLHKKNNPKNEEISNTLGFSDYDLASFPFYQSRKNQIAYFYTLEIAQLSYGEFVCSAVLCLILDCVKNNNSTALMYTATDIFSILYYNGSLAKDVCNIVTRIHISDTFSVEMVFGFLVFLEKFKTRDKSFFERYFNDYQTNVPLLFFYLNSFPFFPESFVSECFSDYKAEKSFFPLILALLNHQNKLGAYSNDDFKKQKNEFLKANVLSKSFINKCKNNLFLDTKTNKQYKFLKFYSCFNNELTTIQKNLIVPLVLATLGTSSWSAKVGDFFTNMFPPETTTMQQRRLSNNFKSQVLSHPRKAELNRVYTSLRNKERLGWLSRDISTNSFLPTLTDQSILFEIAEDFNDEYFLEHPELLGLPELLKKPGFKDLIDSNQLIFCIINGDLYYSTDGMVDSYTNIDREVQKIEEKLNDLNIKNILTLVFPVENVVMEKDHVSVIAMREAFFYAA